MALSPIELQKHLKGLDYPASKDQIVAHAEDKGAPDDILGALRKVPDREYDGPNAVSAEFSNQG